ncbi:ATP-binding protein [Thermostaphylospora chromogena]|uniref:Serine/threonine-protein kinase RsbT n=1 Tax=Thermostaphylospora chromogena TaxID=35622 RepID=A0A1H1CMW1_9ACTN|nr:ATP-binding protein [Thermostaphylospora chromogena]SDQ65557.1 serine/threonine-protein kinase RsbT [Thermostaphylospora chromogena]
MTTLRALTIGGNSDVVVIRREVRAAAVAAGFSIVDQTKIVTAASELTRNVVVHAGEGRAFIELLDDGRRRGLRLTVVDEGPGIHDVRQALVDGWSSSGGLGLGLGGSRRLVDEFDLVSEPGRGTRVTVTKWAR